MSNSRLEISVGFRVSNSEAIYDERVLFFQWYWLEVVVGKMYIYILYRHTDRHTYYVHPYVGNLTSTFFRWVFQSRTRYITGILMWYKRVMKNANKRIFAKQTARKLQVTLSWRTRAGGPESICSEKTLNGRCTSEQTHRHNSHEIT